MAIISTILVAIAVTPQGWHGKPISPEEFTTRLHFSPVRLVNNGLVYANSRVVWVPKNTLSGGSPGFQVLASEYTDREARILMFQHVPHPGRDIRSDYVKLIGYGFFSELKIPKYSTFQTESQPTDGSVAILVMQEPDEVLKWQFKKF